MTPREQATTKKAIQKIFDLQIRACKRGDLEALFQTMWNSPEFIAIMTDGARLDYQGVKTFTAELFESAPSVKFTRAKDDFLFLSKDLVLYAWNGKCDMTLRAGGNSRIDSYAVTYVFRKIGKEWKIIFSHESASPVLEQKPKK